MFTLRFLNHHHREYISTGDPRAQENLFIPPLQLMLGEVPPEVEAACREIVRLNAEEAGHQKDIARCLSILEQQDLSKASDLTVASVLALRYKFDFFVKVWPAKQGDIQPILAFVKTYGDLVPKCWNAFEKIFQLIAFEPASDPELFPRYLSRFTHFFQAYQVNAEDTARNQSHAEKMASSIVTALMKHVMSVPPAKQGHNYTPPKMARELVLTMHLKFPKSEDLRRTANLVLTLSYDYLNCVSFQESKRGMANTVFRGRRAILDDMLEGKLLEILIPKDPKDTTQAVQDVGRMLFDRLQASLLEDLANCAMVNTFGSEKNEAYEEPDVLHFQILTSNEVLDGHVFVIIFKGRFVVKYLPGVPKEVAAHVRTALDMATRGEIGCLTLWQDLVKRLKLKEMLKEVESLVAGERINQVYVYPDGCLWNVPWPYLFNVIWSDIRKPNYAEVPKVALKLGARSVSTKATAEQGIFAAGWNYRNAGLLSRFLRRGQRENRLLPDLPGAREEARELHTLWKRNSQSVHDDALTADGLLAHVQQLTSKTILHVACHGEAFPCGLPILWLPSSDSDKKYSALHFERVLRTDWSKCEFAFFNACFGAAGVPFVGGPSLGLQESLSIAGVRLLLAPLWPVSDGFAKEMALSFYQELLRTKDYLDAFAAVKAAQPAGQADRRGLTYAAYNFVML